MRMKVGLIRKIKILLGVGMLCVFMAPIHAVCNKQLNEHKDKKIANCWYSQKDLERIRQKDAERYKQMGISENTCFYCGCDVAEHTEE